MDPLPSDWRTLGDAPTAPPPRDAPQPAAERAGAPSWRSAPVLAAALLSAAGLLAVIGVATATVTSDPGTVVVGADAAGLAGRGGALTEGSLRPSAATGRAPLVVDVQGAVARPGVQRLQAGARVGDAIAAAGGYGPRVDVAAASRLLNLAAPLSDGEKVHVPVLGETGVAAPGTAGAPGAGPADPGAPALIDLNHADTAALESLPGIGPVTAGEIIAARAATPFASVEDLRSRGLVGEQTFERLRTLVTVSP